MRRAFACGVLLTGLSLLVTTARGQGPQPPYQPRETWYEFLLRQFNPSDFDYGEWIEERRQALLEATVQTPYFWYSTGVTAPAATRNSRLHQAVLRLQAEHVGHGRDDGGPVQP